MTGKGWGAEDEWGDEKVTLVKREINNLLWMYARGTMTLEEADEIACKVLNLLREVDK